MCRYSRPSARAIDERERYGRPQRTVLEVPVGGTRYRCHLIASPNAPRAQQIGASGALGTL
jgi:hypothetical protein